MTPIIFLSHATPYETDVAERNALNRFVVDLENDLRRLCGADGRPDHLVFLSERNLPAGDRFPPNLLHRLNECPIGIVLLQPSYLSPARPACRWEFETIRKRSEWALENISGKPKLLFIVDWVCCKTIDLPPEFPHEIQRVRESIAGDHQENAAAVRAVTSEGLLTVLKVADPETEARRRYVQFVECLAKCIHSQYLLLKKSGQQHLPNGETFQDSLRWTPSHGKLNSGEGPIIRTELRKVVSTVVAAAPKVVRNIEQNRAWRYLDVGRHEWRPYALDESEDNSRIKDILESLQRNGTIGGEVIFHSLNESLRDEIIDYEGKYPFIIFVDPWTIAKVEESKKALRDFFHKAPEETGTSVVISLRIEGDDESAQTELDSEVAEFFKALKKSPLTASSIENLSRVLRSEVEKQRNRIRVSSKPSVVRSGAPIPTLSATT